jgi:hypothetical protein
VSDPEAPDIARLRAALASFEGKSDSTTDAGRIFDALHGELSAAEREAVVDELVVNAEAAEAWRLARELTPESGETRALTPERGPLWTWVPLAAAAVLVLAVGGQVFGPWRVGDEPVYRSSDQRSISSQLPNGAALSRAKPSLRWTAIEGARYRVRVLTAALEPLEEASDLTAAEYTLSAETLNKLPPGAQLLWQVEARIPGAARIVSPTFTARLE